MDDLLRVGVITTTHGIRGEVKVFPTTATPDRFESIDKVFLVTKREELELEIERVRYFKNLVILKFKGIDNINDIEKYKGAELYVDREHGDTLSEGEYYITDIIGLKVIDESENLLGEVADVMETGANDVYVVRREGQKDLLIPAIKDCILSIDIESEKMIVRLLDGLSDL